MTAAESGARAVAETLAREADRYLIVVERFAALSADPHAVARARAARARADECRVSPAAASKRRGVRRWRR